MDIANRITSMGALILAGGLNRRMGGTPKLMLTLDGKTYLQRLEHALQPFSEKLISLGYDSSNLSADISTSFTTVQDMLPEQGPLGGLAAALSFCQSEALVVCACDMPFITLDFAMFLAEIAKHYPYANALAVRDRSGQLHPLCGVYRKEALIIILQALESGEHRVGNVFHEMNGVEITLNGTLFSDKTVSNINTPKDIERFLSN